MISLSPIGKIWISGERNIHLSLGKKYLYSFDSFLSYPAWQAINSGAGDNATMYGSNAVYLNGVDQSVDLPIIHDLSTTDTKQTATLGTGWVDNGADSYTATDATSALSTLTSSATNNVQITFTISNYSAGDVEGFSADGTYTIDVNDASLDATAFTGDVQIVSVYEITIPTNSYMTFFNIDDRAFEQIANEYDRDNSSKELIVNGDFSDGLNGWRIIDGDNTRVENEHLVVDSSGDRIDVRQINTNVFKPFTRNSVQWYQEPSSVSNFQTRIQLLNYNTYVGSSDYINGVGVKTFVFEGVNADNFRITPYDFTGGITYDNFSIKQVIPISTTFNMDKSFQLYFTHTKALTVNELAQLNENPNLLFEVWFNGVTLVDGFSNGDMVDFVPANEGAAGGALVQNLADDTNYLDTLVFDIPNDIYIVSFPKGTSSFYDSSLGRVARYENDGVVDQMAYVIYYSDYSTLPDNKDMIVKFRARSNSGLAYILTIDGLKMTIGTEWTDIVLNITSGSGTAGYIQYYYNTADDFIDVAAMSVVPGLPMQNYTTSCRDTYANVEFGATNFLLQQDASGRPTGVMPVGQIAGSDDGRYIEVPPSLTQYPITSCTSEMSGDDDTALTITPC